MSDKKTVFTQGAWTVVRTTYYGFRCNSLSVNWEIHFDGKWHANALRLKSAKEMIARSIKGGAPA